MVELSDRSGYSVVNVEPLGSAELLETSSKLVDSYELVVALIFEQNQINSYSKGLEKL